MIRLLVVLVVVQSAVALTEPSLDDVLAELFGLPDDNDINLTSPACNDVEGKGQGCHECYFCNDTKLKDERLTEKDILHLQLKGSTCAKTEVCCASQGDLLNLRLGENCGKSNPDGIPRKRRPSPRAVLQGELPWQAWVYKKNSAEPLCAATFVHERSLAVLTLASCLKGLMADSVEVAFVKEGQRSAVSKVIVHESYRPGQDTNNIALLKLRSPQSVPDWASPACLPLVPPMHATPCITTSVKNIRLNTVIPLRKACTASKAALPGALTCAAAAPGDYAPQAAAGLYCKEQYVMNPAYIVYGVAISGQASAVTKYVNVWHYNSWINQHLKIN